VIDGSVPLAPFLPQPDGLTWLTALPASNFTPTTTPTTLLVNGARRLRARSPNAVDDASSSVAGQFGDAATYHARAALAACSSPAWGSCPDVDRLGFVYNASEDGASPRIDPSANVTGAWALVFQSWTAEWVPLGPDSFVASNATLLFAQPAQSAVGTYGFTRGTSPAGGRFLLENSRDFLDAPGEWYAAPLPDGRVWYIPLPGETPSTVAASAPALRTLIEIQGQQPGDPVVNFTLEDVELRGWGEWSPSARAGADPSFFGGLMVDMAANTTVRNVTLHAGATTAVMYSAAVDGLVLDRLSVTDVGGSGVGGLYGNNQNATRVSITNCTVRGVGNVYLAQPVGIAAAGRGVSVLHNEVSDVLYAGIMFVQPGGPEPGAQRGGGGDERSSPSPSSSASSSPLSSPSFPPFPPPFPPVGEIAFNNISHYGLGVLNDFGGIYVAVYGDCWLSDSCWLPLAVHHNLVRGGRSYNYGANGIYLDQALSGANLHHNVVADVGGVALEGHCGLDNRAVNNILYAPQAQAQAAGGASRSGAFGGCNAFGFPPNLNSTFNLTGNIVLLTHTPWLTSGEFAPPNDDYIMPSTWASDRNVFFGVAPSAPTPLHYPNDTVGLPAWRLAWAQDLDSVEADPQIADPGAGNFTVLPSSPAWALGWEEVDVSGVGPEGG
jgi:hypothetical protein